MCIGWIENFMNPLFCVAPSVRYSNSPLIDVTPKWFKKKGNRLVVGFFILCIYIHNIFTLFVFFFFVFFTFGKHTPRISATLTGRNDFKSRFQLIEYCFYLLGVCLSNTFCCETFTILSNKYRGALSGFFQNLIVWFSDDYFEDFRA